MEKTNSENRTDEDILTEITEQVKERCAAGNYQLNKRIQTEAGLKYVVNRCIHMMAHDRIHLSSALAHLESEENGVY
jgi:hypothetical protein